MNDKAIAAITAMRDHFLSVHVRSDLGPLHGAGINHGYQMAAHDLGCLLSNLRGQIGELHESEEEE